MQHTAALLTAICNLHAAKGAGRMDMQAHQMEAVSYVQHLCQKPANSGVMDLNGILHPFLS